MKGEIIAYAHSNPLILPTEVIIKLCFTGKATIKLWFTSNNYCCFSHDSMHPNWVSIVAIAVSVHPSCNILVREASHMKNPVTKINKVIACPQSTLLSNHSKACRWVFRSISKQPDPSKAQMFMSYLQGLFVDSCISN